MACVYNYKGKTFSSRKALSDYLRTNEIVLKDLTTRANLILTKDQDTELTNDNRLLNDVFYVETDQFENDSEQKEFEEMVERAKNVSPRDETKIKNKINEFLQTLGVRVEFGTEKGINGIAKILEGVVTMREGYTTEEILEEISHFALEMWSGSNLESYDYRSYVRQTPMYQKFSRAYREKYSKDGLTQEQLERKVDLEILGKILAEQIYIELTSENTATPQYQGFFGTIKQFVRDFLNFIFNEKSVDNLLAEIYTELSKGNQAQFQNQSFLFDYYYSLANTLTQDIKSNIDKLHSTMRTEERIEIEKSRMMAESLIQQAQQEGWTPLKLNKEIESKTKHILVKGELKTTLKEGDAVVQSLANEATGYNIGLESLSKYLSIWIPELKRLNIIANSSTALFSIYDILKAQYALNELVDELNSIVAVASEPENVEYKDAFDTLVLEAKQLINSIEIKYSEKIKHSAIVSIREEMEAVGASEEVIKETIQNSESIIEDINMYQKEMLSKSTYRDPLMGFVYQLINRATTRIAKIFNDTYVPLINYVNSSPAKEMIDKLKGMHDGKRTGWVLHQYNQAVIKEKREELIKKYLGTEITEEELKRIYEGEVVENVLESEEKVELFYAATNRADSEMIERPFTTDFYEAKESDISTAIQNVINSGEPITDTERLKIMRKIKYMGSHLQSLKAEIFEKYRDKDGNLRIENMTAEHKAELESINMIYKLASTKYNRNGLKKKGFDLQIALVLEDMKKSFFNASGEVSETDIERFVDEFNNDPNKKLDWLKKVGVISFTSEFGDTLEEAYNNVGTFDLSKQETRDKLESLKLDVEQSLGESVDFSTEQGVREALEKLNEMKKDLMMPYRMGQEIIVQQIPQTTLNIAEKVHSLAGTINALKTLTDQEQERIDALEAEFIPTAQFEIDRSNGLVESKHLTDKGKPKFYYRKMAQTVNIEQFDSASPFGKISTPVPNVIYMSKPTGERFIYNPTTMAFENIGKLDKKKGEVYLEQKDQTGQTKTYLVSIKPSQTWLDSKKLKDKANPNYNEKMRGRAIQYKSEIIDANGNKVSLLDDRYFDTFGVSKTDIWGEPKQNLELYELRQKLLDAKENHDKNHIFIKNSYFLEPQVYRQKFELTQGTNFKEFSISYLKQNFEALDQDAEEYGNLTQDKQKFSYSLKGSKVRKQIPKFYTKPIDPSLLSDNLLYSYMMYGTMAINFNEKSKVALKSEKIRTIMKNKMYKSGTDLIKGEVSKTYAALSSFIDRELYSSHSISLGNMNILGKNVSVSKTLNYITSTNSISKMGYNKWVAVTGSMAGYLSRFKERYAQRFYNKTDIDFVSSELEHFKNATEISSNTNKYKIFVLMNNLGLIDLRELAEKGVLSQSWNTIFNTLSPFSLMRMLDMPHKMDAALHAMIFYRKIGEKWMSYNAFIEQQVKDPQNPMTIEQANKEWDKYMDKSLYNMIEVDSNGEVKYLDKTAESLIENAGNIARRLHSETTMELKEIDKPDVMRHPASKLIGLFKNYFFSASSYWFQSRKYDQDLGIYTSGAYFTMMNNFRLLAKMVFTLADAMENNPNLTPYEVAQLKRIQMDVYTMLVLFGLFVLANNAADDDEDNVMAQLGAIYSARLLDETLGGTPIGLGFTAYETARSPLSTLLGSQNSSSLFSFSDVKSGPYKGFSKTEKLLLGLTPANNIIKLANADLDNIRTANIKFRSEYTNDLRELLNSAFEQ